MIVFVDYEHADRAQTKMGERIQAARTWITYRLEDLSGRHCMLVRYNRVTPELLTRLGVRAIFISGNGTDPAHYEQADLASLQSIVQTTQLPVFGFCGGFQFFSQALGAELVPLDADPEVDNSPGLTTWPNGQVAEYGYYPVDLIADHPLLDGLGHAPVFRHAHGLHVPKPPEGFDVLASTRVTPVQLAVSDERKIVGAQFHPEYWTDEHPAGKTLIANFMTWAGL